MTTSFSSDVAITSTTGTTGSTNGALVVAGGVGINNNLFVAGDIVCGGGLTYTLIDNCVIGSGTPLAATFTTATATNFHSTTMAKVLAIGSATAITAGGTVAPSWTTKTYDVTSNFVASTSVFTAPRTGYYRFTVKFSTSTAVAAVAQASTVFKLNASVYFTEFQQLQVTATGKIQTWGADIVIPMTSGNTVTVQANSAVAVTLGANSHINVIELV